MSNQDALLKDCLSKVKDDKLDDYTKKLGSDLRNTATKDKAYTTYTSNLKNLYGTLDGNITNLKNCIKPATPDYGLIVGLSILGLVVFAIFAYYAKKVKDDMDYFKKEGSTYRTSVYKAGATTFI